MLVYKCELQSWDPQNSQESQASRAATCVPSTREGAAGDFQVRWLAILASHLQVHLETVPQ